MPAVKHVWDGTQWRGYSNVAPPASYGAAALGATNYTIPAGAKFVSPTGSNSNSGTEASPYLTFEHAAGVIGTGGTIVMRAGVYHEGKTRTTGSNLGYVAIAITAANVTVQNYPGEIVWFDGSSVYTGFVADGASWSRAWTPFRRDPQYSWNSDAAYNTAISTDNWEPLDGTDQGGGLKYWQFVDYVNWPAAARPERVWLDGIQLTQVVTLGALGAGKFFINAQTNKIHLGENPAGKTVRITDLQTCVNFIGDGAKFRGIGVRRYAASNPQGGTIKFHRASPLIENVHVEDVGAYGVSFLGASSNICAHDFVARSISVSRAGNLGIHIDMSDRGLVESSYFKNCNDKRFAYAPSAGGIKATHYRKLTVDRSLFEDNYGKHLWFDIDCYDTYVTRNIFRRSYQRSIVFELGDVALVAGNLFDQSAIDSLAPVDFDGLRCWNNTFMRAGWHRNQPDTSITDWFSNPRTINLNRTDRIPHGTVGYDADARDTAGTIPDWPIVPGHSPGQNGGNVFRNNVITFGDVQQFLADEDFRKNDAPPAAISSTTAGTNFDYNVYQQLPGSNLQFPWNMSSTGSGNQTAFSIAQVRSLFGQENNGTQLTTTTICVDTTTGQLIPAHSALHATATPLPADIAAAIGQDTGARHMGAFPPPDWQVALQAGTNAVPTRIQVLGDSISFGAAAFGNSTPKWLNSWPGQLRTAVAVTRGNAGTGCVIGNNETNGIRANPTYDGRWAWAGTVTDTQWGYHKRSVFTTTSGAGNYVEFTTTCTEFVLTVLAGTAGMCNVTVDGGATLALRNLASGGGTPDIEREAGTRADHIVTRIPAGALGSHTLRVWGNGGDCNVLSIEGCTEAGSIIIDNTSISGKSLGTFMGSGNNDETTGRYGLPLLDTLNPTLLLVCLGINDWQVSTATATISTYLTTLVQRRSAVGKFTAFWLPPAASPSLGGSVPWADYQAVFAERAAALGVALQDDTRLYVNYNQSLTLQQVFDQGNAAGNYADSIHPNDVGAAKIANSIRYFLGV